MPSYTINLQTWVDNAAIGTRPWATPGAAEFVDAVTSQGPSNLTPGTHYLFGTNPTVFSVTPSEVLDTITATVTRFRSPVMPGDAPCFDWHLFMVKAGVITSIDKADTGTIWPKVSTDAVYTWSKADLATLGITLSDLLSSTFGVAFAVNAPTGGGLVNAFVDAIIYTVNTIVLPVLSGGMTVIPPYGVQT